MAPRIASFPVRTLGVAVCLALADLDAIAR